MKGGKRLKATLFSILGVVGSFIASAFGGWDDAIVTLLIFMGIDYITGLIVAGVFKKSTKTNSGALESRAGWKGLIKKCVTLLFIVVGVRLDLLTGSNYIRDALCIAFITNELLSIVENGRLMGIPMPAIVTDAIDLLNTKGKKSDE